MEEILQLLKATSEADALEKLKDLLDEREYLWNTSREGRLMRKLPLHWRIRRSALDPTKFVAFCMAGRIDNDDLFYLLQEVITRSELFDIPPLPEDRL